MNVLETIVQNVWSSNNHKKIIDGNDVALTLYYKVIKKVIILSKKKL